MPKILVIEHDGTEHHVDAPTGVSVMQSVMNASIPGFFADCSGQAICGNCHGYVDENWTAQIPEAKDSERETLEWADEVQDNSRLTCQIPMTDALDGIVIRLPERQD
ncbi:MAG TPA: 2Fe-2S iron-sulfur cluster-binding protein [Pseudomonas sp.]|nr:2Fe-2S iron-sulfur cluster-binding protein [Pseudomonas sp.]